jgi:hypothetical protein
MDGTPPSAAAQAPAFSLSVLRARTSRCTSSSARPWATASARQSSYSGLQRTTSPPSRATFTRTCPQRVATVRVSRASLERCHRLRRTPSVVVCRQRASSAARSRSGSHSTVTCTPGRFFFICTADVKASSAPASASFSMQ